MSQRSWAPAGVWGGSIVFAGAVETAAVGGGGTMVCVPADVHAAASSTTASSRATPNGRAARRRPPPRRESGPSMRFLLYQPVSPGRPSDHQSGNDQAASYFERSTAGNHVKCYVQ